MLLINTMDVVRNMVISDFAGAFAIHPAQSDKLLERDLKVIRPDSGAVPAIDMDTVGKEFKTRYIRGGLYRGPG
ncbi:MAG: hypothetical protein LLG37_04510 [Spirochaetia bacterium]|nr:hypothetical protein [Spirochaetia bacterium]